MKGNQTLPYKIHEDAVNANNNDQSLITLDVPRNQLEPYKQYKLIIVSEEEFLHCSVLAYQNKDLTIFPDGVK